MAQVIVWCDVLSQCLGCATQYVGGRQECCGEGFRSQIKVFSMVEKPESSKRWYKQARSSPLLVDILKGHE